MTYYGSTAPAPGYAPSSAPVASAVTAPYPDDSPLRMGPLSSLHPDLARIYVEYQNICADYYSGRLSEESALGLIAKLRVRDDQGVFWGLSPDGTWLRTTRTGQMVPAPPPTTGFAAVTPYSVSPYGNDPQNPDRLIAKPDVRVPYETPYRDRSSRVSDSPTLWRRFLAYPHRRLALALASITFATVTAVSALALTAPATTSDAAPQPTSAAVTIVVEP